MTKFGQIFGLLAAFLLIASGTALGQHFEFSEGDRSSHAIVIREATIDGETLVDEDEIGVFTPDGICAGASVISDDPPFGVTAWGDDPGTEAVEGFLDSEDFSFKVWDASEETELNASFNYVEGDEQWTADGFTILSRVFAFSTPEPVIDFSAVELDFGTVLVDNSRDLVLTISNIGFADLTVSDISSDDGAFTSDFGDDIVIEPAGSADVTLSFTPDQAGNFAATLSITSDDAEVEVSEVALTGVGTNTVFSTIALSREVIDFGEYPLESNDKRILNISNDGTGDLTISNITIDEAGFSTNWDGNDLVVAPDENVDLEVTFSPEETMEYNATLTIESDAQDNESVEVALHGIGIEFNRHFFFRRTDTDHSLLVLSATIIDDFNEELLIAGDEIGVFTEDGICAGAVVLRNVDPDADEWYNRMGAGLAAFGDDDETDEIDGFQNREPFAFRLWDLSDGQEYEAIAEFGEFDLDTWRNRAISFVTLTAERDPTPNISLIPPEIDFGGVYVRESGLANITVRNSGFADLRVFNMEISDPDHFTIDFEAGFVLGAREEREFEVEFIPVDSADYDAVLTVTSNDEDESELEVSLVGVGLAPLPELTVAEDDLDHDFGTIIVRRTGTWDLVITNNGWLNLILDRVEFDDPVFSSDMSEEPDTLAPEEETVIQVSFDPEEATDYSATMSIFSNHMGEADYEFTFHLTGSGMLQPQLDLDPPDVEFGGVDIRAQFAEGDELPLTVTNVGSGDLTVTNMVLEGDAFAFNFESEFTLTPDESREITVLFDPEELIDYDGSITISSDDPEAEEVIVALTGTGIYINHEPSIDDSIAAQELEEDFDPYGVVNLSDIFSDLDGDDLTFSAVSDPEGLTFEVDEESMLLLGSDADWNGEAVVTVTADDGFDDNNERDRGPIRQIRGLRKITPRPTARRSLRSVTDRPVLNPLRDATNQVQFNVTVAAINDQPVWVEPPDSVEGDENVQIEFTVTAEDVDGNPLTLTYSSEDLPDEAQFVDNEDGTGAFTWTPSYETVSAVNQTEDFVANFNVSDDTLENDVDVLITVTHVNRPPLWVNAPQDIEISEGDTIDIEMTGEDLDGDDMTITYLSDDLPDNVVFVDGENGTATFYWETDPQDGGEYSAFFTLEDDQFRVTRAISITVINVNRPPEWVDVPEEIEVDEGEDIEFDVVADDPDNDRLTLTMESDLPEDAAFFDRRNETGGFSWSPSFQDAGEYTATFIVTDGEDSDSAEVTIIVNDLNRDPRWTEIPNAIHVDAGVKARFNMAGEDEDDDDLTITYESETIPDRAVFNDNGNGTAEFSWRTTEEYDGTAHEAFFTLSDGAVDVTHRVIITVGEGPQPPDWVEIPEILRVRETSVIEFEVVTTDPNDDEMIITMESDNLPEAASFTDNGDGTGDFIWETTYDDAGEYSALFTVADTVYEVTALVEFVISNLNRAPVWIDVPDSIVVNESETVDFSIFAEDADLDNIFITFQSNDIPEAALLDDNHDGSGDFTWETNFEDAGRYTATFSAADDEDEAIAEVEIIVINVNHNPFWVDVPEAVEVDEGSLLRFRVSADDDDSEDQDNLRLSFNDEDMPDGVTLSDFGDGTGFFAWEPGYDEAGEYTAVLTVTDLGDLTDIAEVAITVNHVNRTPIYVVRPSSEVTINEAERYFARIVGNDPDDDDMTVTFDPGELPDGYEFTDNGDGTAEFDWTPGYDDNGEYTLTYTLSDGAIEVTTQTVLTVEHTNRPPVWDDAVDVDVDENVELVLTVAGSDPDDDGVTIAYESEDISQDAEFVDNGDGTATLTWTPGDNSAGVYTATFTISDDQFGTPADVMITVNLFPEAVNYPEAGIDADEDEPIEFSLITDDPDDADISWAMTDNDLPEGWTFEDLGGGNGNFQWTPSFDDAGEYFAEFTASMDELATPFVVDFTINHVNREPVWTDELEVIIDGDEDEEISFTVIGEDPDGDDLSIAYESDDLPEDAEFVDNGDGTGTFTWTPTFDESRTYTAMFTLSDAEFDVGPRRIRVRVNHVNRSPVFTDVPDSMETNEGTTLEFTVGGEDPDDDLLFISMNEEDFPDHVRFRDLGTGSATFTWRTNYDDAGNYVASFILADDDTNVTVDVAINIVENQGPAVANPVNDLALLEDFDRIQVADLNEVFADNEDDELTFFEDWGDGIDVELTNEGILYISSTDNWFGQSWVSLTASDRHSSVVDSFDVNVLSVEDDPVLPDSGGIDPNIEIDEDGGEHIIAKLDTVFYDPEGDPLFFWTEGGEHLNPNIDEETVLSIHPDEDWAGEESFIVWADDEPPASPKRPGFGTPRRDDGTSFVINVVVPNVNDAPKVGVPIDNQNLNEDEGPWNIADLDFVLVDPDGDAVEYSVVVDDPLEATIDDDTHDLIITAPENYFTDASLNVLITAEDINQTTGEYEFTIDIASVNDLPTVDIELDDVTVDEDSGPWMIADLTTIFSDLDDAVLTYTVVTDEDVEWIVNDLNELELSVPVNFSAEAIDVTVTADDGHDAVTGFGPVRALRSTDGLANPTRDATASTEFVLSITAVNDAPTITSSPDPISVDERESISFEIEFTDLDLQYEGDQLTIVMSDEGGVPGTAIFYQNSENSGAFSWTTDQDDAGAYDPEFTVTDGAGAEAAVTVTINVGNVNRDPERVAAIGVQTVEEDAGMVNLGDLNDHFSDADGDALEFSLVVSDESAVTATVGADGELLVTPADNWNGQVTIDVTASDETGTPATDSFTLVVNSVNDLPEMFTLLGPTDGKTTHDFPKVEFSWEATIDTIDMEEDVSITYSVAVYLGNRTIWFRDVSETSVWIDRARIAVDPNNETELTWEVFANDGVALLASTDIFNLTVAPLTLHERSLLMMPEEVELGPLYPNPFNSLITIEFGLPEPYLAEVNVYDMSGRLVKKLVNSVTSAGHHIVTWDGSNQDGFDVSAGVYLVRITTPEAVKLQQIILMK